MAMVEIERAGTADTLEYFHGLLDRHFSALHARRMALGSEAPVFGLEHGLGESDRHLLHAAVAAAHREGLLTRASNRWWLPLMVHAAEVGYDYDGVEYWPIYAEATPNWYDSQHERDRVRRWFRRFADEYGGAVPRGAWATVFSKIAWPITHAVLPRYLQVQLAKMLYDYRTGWPSLLEDPEALGERLHAWSRHYGERLEKFCQNTVLLGNVAVALLLSGKDEPSPYIESSTLDRLVDSLNSERQSRRWLHDARHSASTVRTRNFLPSATGRSGRSPERRVPALTDPKLQLRLESEVWHAYAVIPDLRPLQHSLPTVYDALRNSRASVAGSREIIRSGALLYALAPVELSVWPSSSEPFLQLKNASPNVNLLIADQCRMTGGPWWVFRVRQGAPADEVKGRFVRPGGTYCIVGTPDLTPPAVEWCERSETAIGGVRVYSLQVPSALSERDSRILVSAGLSVVTDLSIQPVGVTAEGWDGEGAGQWPAGEPVLVVVRTGQPPQKCRFTVNGDLYYVEWPARETELFVSLDGLAVGTHEVTVALNDRDGHSSGGTLSVGILDPRTPAEGVSSGEGIRLRTSPAEPTLPELWDGRAVIEVDGPDGTTAELAITLHDGDSNQLGDTRRHMLELPVKGDDWRRLFARFRATNGLAQYYDDAESAEFAISRAGVGFAAVSCERGFRGLRWALKNAHGRGYTARLIDRTDSETVSVDFFPMDHPLNAQMQPLGCEFAGPPRGGLLWARSGDQTAGQIVPPDPNELLRIGATIPFIAARPRSLAEARALITHHRRWSDAELPAHPFGARDRQHVLQAITTALAVLLTGGHWAHFEQDIALLAPEDVDLDRAKDLVGVTPHQRAAAEAIASHLWQWNSPETLIMGFSDAVADLAASSGMKNTLKGARFLLQLASAPGELDDWERADLDLHLRCLLTDPVLVRAARFAVLGTSNDVAGGVG